MPKAFDTADAQGTFQKMVLTYLYSGHPGAFAEKLPPSCYSVVCEALREQEFLPTDQIVALGREHGHEVLHCIITRDNVITVDGRGDNSSYDPHSGVYTLNNDEIPLQNPMFVKGRITLKAFYDRCEAYKDSKALSDNLITMPI